MQPQLSTKKKTREEDMGEGRHSGGGGGRATNSCPSLPCQNMWQGCSREQAGLQSYHTGRGFTHQDSGAPKVFWRLHAGIAYAILCPTPLSLPFSLLSSYSLKNSKELGKIYLFYLLGSLGSLLPKDLTEEMFWDKGLSRYSVTPRFFWSFELGAIQNREWGQFLSPTYFVISNSNSHNSIHISIMVLFSVWDVPRNRFRVLLTKYAACSHRKP